MSGSPEAKRRYYERNKAACKARAAAWNKAHPEVLTGVTTSWGKRNPEKKRAHNQVYRALRDGRLHREPCEVCGSTEKVQAHHDDYSKPLDVRWLCSRHHAEVTYA